MINQVEIGKRKELPLGVYLVEAGIVTPEQVDMALNEQKFNTKRLGEILVEHDWVAQQTIEYFIEKIVLPERQTSEKKLSCPKKHPSHNLTLVEQVSQPKTRNSDLLLLPPVTSPEVKINLFPRRTIQFLFFVVLGLVLLSLIGQFTVYFLPNYPLRNNFAQLFNVDLERNIPTMYSASALLFCSILLAIIANAKKIAGNTYLRHWTGLSIIFLYLSLDEALIIHDKLIKPLRSTFNASGFLYFTWVIPGAIFVLVCLLAFLKFLTHLPAQTRRLFLIAGLIFVTGALGVEMVGGYYSNLYGERNIGYAIITTIEELLEMLGIVAFIYALLSYMSFHITSVGLQVNFINDKKQRLRAR